MEETIAFQIFAKAPRAGAVKTRLQPTLSGDDAARLYERLLVRTVEAVALVCRTIAGAHGELWCSPDADDSFLRAIAGRHALSLCVQADGDLGRRMSIALGAAMPGRALLMGSDCALLDSTRLVAACRALDDRAAVFIPAEDGGYALVGCRHRVPDCFSAIPWSTDRVMAMTRTRLTESGQGWIELPEVWDVDTAAELERLARDATLSHLLDGLGCRLDADRPSYPQPQL
ncbi:MAG: TIGR04282 family arsenosugar biosynthesis glycosyltransferase [Betaproteobacteria bacterium]